MAKYLNDTALAELVSKTKSLVNTKGGVYRGTFGNWSTVPSSASGYEADANGNTTPLKDDYMILNDGSGKLDDSSFLYLSDTSGSRASIANTYNGNTQSVVYYNVTGEGNATTLNGVVSVYYNSNTGKWVVKTLKACTFNSTTYAVGDIIAQWGYSTYAQGYIAYEANTNGGIFVYDGVWSTDGKNGWKTAASILSMTTGIQNAINTKQDAITSTNKLDYSLIANTPTVVDNIQNGNMNAVTSNAVYDAVKPLMDDLDTKQDTLTAGTGINIDSNNVISATGLSITIDSALSTTSTNPVQNKVVTGALNNRLDLTDTGNQIVKGNVVFENDENNSLGTATFTSDSSSSDNYSFIFQDIDGGLQVRTTDVNNSTQGEQQIAVTPDYVAPIQTDNVTSLGKTGARWKDLHIGGNLTDGTNSISVANIVAKQNAITSTNKLDYSLLSNTPTIPTVNNATLTVQLNGSTIDTFTANASSNKTVNVKALPNYSLSIGSTNGGNPRQVLFCSVNYTNFDSNSGAYFKLGAMSGHGNGSSYTFVEDIFINVNYQGTVTCQVYKYVQQAVTLDNVARNYGDVFYTIDTTNKIVYFYILLGQYSSAQFTPATKIGAAKAVTSANGIVQNSGTPTYYSSGTKTWATGDSATYLRSIDSASSVAYTTTAPSAANTNGLKFVLLDSEPATKYAGWIYMIKES